MPFCHDLYIYAQALIEVACNKFYPNEDEEAEMKRVYFEEAQAKSKIA
jgi:hypothetical protein